MILFCAFLVLAMLVGGGSRPDVLSHVVLRPVSVVLSAFAIWKMDRGSLDSVRTVLSGLLALAGVMLIQLIPLPPAVWTALPGRELAAAGAGILDLEQPWRPISLSPARTWNSLVSLFPPICAVLLFALVPGRRRVLAVTLIIMLLAASAVLGIAQRAGPEGGPLYLYRITNQASAVGFFANRNHQAAMLATMVPMLAAFALFPAARRGGGWHRKWVAVVATISLIPLLLATGSRSGLLLFLIAVGGAALLLRTTGGRRGAASGTSRKGLLIALAVAGVALAGLTVYLSQAEALARFAGGGLANDLRVRLLPTYFAMVSATFPVGIGFGAFEPVFRAYEPIASLDPAYLNNAHNDLLQLAIEGGLAGLAVLLAFIGWFAIKAFRIWQRPRDADITPLLLARLGSVTVALLLLASLTDYPLRVPFVMIVFALAVAWMESYRSPRKAGDIPLDGSPSDR